MKSYILQYCKMQNCQGYEVRSHCNIVKCLSIYMINGKATWIASDRKMTEPF